MPPSKTTGKMKQQSIRDFMRLRKQKAEKMSPKNHTDEQDEPENSEENDDIQYIGSRTQAEALAANRVLDPAVLDRLREFDWCVCLICQNNKYAEIYVGLGP